MLRKRSRDLALSVRDGEAVKQKKQRSNKTRRITADDCDMLGLKAIARDTRSTFIRTVECRFCTTFGREEAPSLKRARTNNVARWDEPSTYFRTELFTKHMTGQHVEKWKEFKSLSFWYFIFFPTELQ